jgi:hypothetical protein
MYIFLEIPRENIRAFEKKGIVEFETFNPPRANVARARMSNVSGMAGLIGGAVFRGVTGAVFSGLEKLENRIRKTKGPSYKLKFELDGEECYIHVVSEEVNETHFNNFLSSQWINGVPEVQLDARYTKCFIATACYGDYNHPDVLVLRKFRDYFLDRFWFGRCLIRFYYLISPSLAAQLVHRKNAKRLVRSLVIQPIISMLPEKYK